jgi:hypothetical protein
MGDEENNIERITLDLLRRDALVPSTVFFQPTEGFIEWLIEYARGRPIIDCGSGVGRLSNILDKKGITVLALDNIIPKNVEYYRTIPMDTTDFNYPKSCLPIIARPSHGRWVSDTILQALRTVEEVIYIGLPENEHMDLLMAAHQDCDIEEIKGKDVGKEGERAWRITR